MKPKFSVGDTVVITSVRDCVFGWNVEMEAQIGREAVIVRVDWRDYVEAYAYNISGEAGTWSWDNTCFEEVCVAEDLPEFSADDKDALLSFLF